MGWKKLGKAVLFPHIGILLLLLPAATAFLVYSMGNLEAESTAAVLSYILALYTLIVWCARIPALMRHFKAFRAENIYARRWLEDTALRMNVFLCGALVWNIAYAAFQLWLGFYHGSFWFISIAIYYICLGAMRLFLLRHTVRYAPGEQMGMELVKYRACGWVFLGVNLALSVMIFFMVYWNRTFRHHEITTITMAAYTFASLTLAIINAVKYRKFNSPVYSAAKAISLAAAWVSMLTLESTMLTTFGSGSTDLLTRRILLGSSGAAVSAFIIAMAVYMIVQGSKKLK